MSLLFSFVLLLALPLAFVLPVMWIYGMYDAFRTAGRINRREVEFNRKSRLFWLPVGCFVVSILIFTAATVVPSALGVPPPKPPKCYKGLTPAVAATARGVGNSIQVTWQGGPDNSCVRSYNITIYASNGTYYQTTDLPPVVGSTTRFPNVTAGQFHVEVIPSDTDGYQFVILNTYVSITPVPTSLKTIPVTIVSTTPIQGTKVQTTPIAVIRTGNLSLPDVPHVPSANVSHCAAGMMVNWTIPQDRYVFIDTGLVVDGVVVEGKPYFVDIDSPGYWFNKTSGELYPDDFTFDYENLKIVLGKGTYMGGIGGGISSILEPINEVPYQGILSVDGNGTTCISFPEFAQETGNGYFGGESTYLSLFAGEDRPIRLRPGDSWTSEIYKTIKYDDNTIRWHLRYVVTNYGIWDKGKIRSDIVMVNTFATGDRAQVWLYNAGPSRISLADLNMSTIFIGSPERFEAVTKDDLLPAPPPGGWTYEIPDNANSYWDPLETLHVIVRSDKIPGIGNVTYFKMVLPDRTKLSEEEFPVN
jgi:hypothetical protein